MTTPGSGNRHDPDEGNQCNDNDCMFSCERFGVSYYCGCPLGYQLVDKG